MLAQLLTERLAGWQETCKQGSVVSLPTFARLAPAAPADTQSVLSMLYQGSYAQGVSNGDATVQNETISSVIGNALSWDSQRQMHAELSSIETIQVESLALPANSPGVLTSTDAYRFESARSGLAFISSNTANAPVVPVSAASVKDAEAQITLPSSPGMALSILDMQGGAVSQAGLRPSQVTEPKTESVGEPIASSLPAAKRNIFSLVSFSSSIPLDKAQGAPNSPPPSPLLGTSPEQPTSDLLPSSDSPASSSQPGQEAIASTVSRGPVDGASTVGSGSQRTSGLEAATTNPAVNARASQAASVLPALPIVEGPTPSPVAPKVKRNSPVDADGQTSLLDQTHSLGEAFLPVAERASMFQVSAVKTASEPAGRATSAETPLPSSGANPAHCIDSGTGLRAGDVAPNSVVDHFSFELKLRPQNPVAAENPAHPTDPGDDDAGAASLALSPRAVLSRPASVAAGSDSDTSALLDGAAGQVAAKRSTDPSNGRLANVPVQSTGSVGTVVSSAQILPTLLTGHATLNPEASSSISTGTTIVLPETKAPTPQGLVHDVQLRLQGEAGENVSVRLSDRSGQIQISVRSSDQATATTLRQDLSTLSASLEKQGWKTDLPESQVQTAVHDAQDPSNRQQADQQGRQRSTGEWQDPPDRKRQNATDQWADINEQETT